MAEEIPGEGEGVEIYPYGEYEGGRDNENERHGYGSALLPNYDIYEGEYHHGKRNGKGMYCFRNGSRYIGAWRKNLKHGEGEFLYPDGSEYAGNWYKDFRQGFGTYYYANGDVYDGAWYKNNRHGLGSYLYSELGVKCIGTWKKGCMDGSAYVVYPDYSFHGIFKHNLPFGKGVFNFKNEYVQEGFSIQFNPESFDDEIDLSPRYYENPEDIPEKLCGVWRSRDVLKYKTELMPIEPEPIPINYSSLSLFNIVKYLEKQYKTSAYQGEEEEDGENAEYYYRQLEMKAALKRLDPTQPLDISDRYQKNVD